jgi:hypothetical protein
MQRQQKTARAGYPVDCRVELEEKQEVPSIGRDRKGELPETENGDSAKGNTCFPNILRKYEELRERAKRRETMHGFC